MKLVHLRETDGAGRAVTRLGIVLTTLGLGLVAARAILHFAGGEPVALEASKLLDARAIPLVGGMAVAALLWQCVWPVLALRPMHHPRATLDVRVRHGSVSDMAVMIQARLLELGFKVGDLQTCDDGLSMAASRRKLERPLFCPGTQPYEVSVRLLPAPGGIRCIAECRETDFAVDTGEQEWCERLLHALVGSRDEFRVPRTVALFGDLPLTAAVAAAALTVVGSFGHDVYASIAAAMMLSVVGAAVPWAVGGSRRRVFYLRFAAMGWVVAGAASSLFLL